MVALVAELLTKSARDVRQFPECQRERKRFHALSLTGKVQASRKAENRRHAQTVEFGRAEARSDTSGIADLQG